MKRRRRSGRLRLNYPSNSDRSGEVLLNTLRAGEKGIVIRVAGGQMMRARMTSLGFVPGTEVVILQNLWHGPMIVRAHDTRIALGRGVAGGIVIRRSES